MVVGKDRVQRNWRRYSVLPFHGKGKIAQVLVASNFSDL